MLTWNILSEFNENNPPKQSLGRSKYIEDKYSIFRNEIVNEYGSVSNYLNKTLFTNNEQFVLKQNDFPYNTSNNIKHYILWINPKYNLYIDDIILKEKLELFFKNKYVFFRNNSDNKSIPSIEHYHIFLNNC